MWHFQGLTSQEVWEDAERLTCLWNWLQGGFPVAISMTVQATDQMSACRPCPVCLMTSGAIQYGVPLMDLKPESAVIIGICQKQL